jgi:hypothetical protein
MDALERRERTCPRWTRRTSGADLSPVDAPDVGSGPVPAGGAGRRERTCPRWTRRTSGADLSPVAVPERRGWTCPRWRCRTSRADLSPMDAPERRERTCPRWRCRTSGADLSPLDAPERRERTCPRWRCRTSRADLSPMDMPIPSARGTSGARAAPGHSDRLPEASRGVLTSWTSPLPAGDHAKPRPDVDGLPQSVPQPADDPFPTMRQPDHDVRHVDRNVRDPGLSSATDPWPARGIGRGSGRESPLSLPEAKAMEASSSDGPTGATA